MDYNYLKVDADFLLNKRIDDRLSVYMGAKSLFMHSSGVYEMSGDADNTTPEYSFNQYSYGPGLGFGYNHPLDEVNFIIFGLSEAILNTRTITYTDSYTAEDQVEETAGNYIVTSTTVKASYAHFDRSTLITYEGGIQYQHLYYMHISGNDSRYNKEQLHYVGPVFNIIYSF